MSTRAQPGRAASNLYYETNIEVYFHFLKQIAADTNLEFFY